MVFNTLLLLPEEGTNTVLSVLRIWIRMFLGLLDPDPLVRGTDLDPSIVKQN